MERRTAWVSLAGVLAAVGVALVATTRAGGLVVLVVGLVALLFSAAIFLSVFTGVPFRPLHIPGEHAPVNFASPDREAVFREQLGRAIRSVSHIPLGPHDLTRQVELTGHWQEDTYVFLASALVDPHVSVQFAQLGKPLEGHPAYMGLGHRTSLQTTYLQQLLERSSIAIKENWKP